MFGILFAQTQKESKKYLDKATITVEDQNISTKYIKFKDEADLSVNEFISEYRSAFSLSDENELRILHEETDELGQKHYRYKQYYNGLELFDTQFLVHEENGTVKSANGEIIQDLHIRTTPAISEEQALSAALAYIGAEKYMWEIRSEEEMLKRVTNNKSSTYYPKGTLGIAAERGFLKADKFKLVYRFDVYAAQPMSRHYVDVDARAGKVINKISRIHTGNVAGFGESLYNGNVNMKVGNKNYPKVPKLPTYFHVESGFWWMADPNLGNTGGYANSWYQVLDSDPITLSGGNPELSFTHRYSAEPPAPYPPFDGWDGMNVRISTDGGTTWEVLANPIPAYANSSLYSFGSTHGEGPGVPGWTGLLDTWTPVTVNLSAYAGQTVQIRFAFASDEAVSTTDDPTWFGWQIDDILISSTAGTLFSNDGSESGMTRGNLATEVTIIAGDYRLRESIRGDGIFTYNMQGSHLYPNAIDYVSSSKTDWPNATGVQVHWATEQTFDYFKTKHNRTSFDDEGGRLVSYASYLPDGFPASAYPNAFWNGQFMTYGDGYPGLYGPLVSLDVVGHELTHGVTERSAGLIYQGESGALNESISDIFGNLIEFFAEGYSDEVWGVGEDFDLNGNSGFRSMSDPNSKGDPDTYKGNNWVGTTPLDPDNGGVHTNSGVQNYWFYLLAHGGSGTNDNGDDYDVEGIGLNKSAKIVYRSLTIYLTPYSAYYAARNGSIEAAEDLYGKNSKTVETVKAAWDAVGVYELQPLYNIDNLIAYIEGLGLTASEEASLVDPLTNARGLLGNGDLDNAFAEIGMYQDQVIDLYFVYGAIDLYNLYYLYYEGENIYEMYSQNPNPPNNRPKPQVQTVVDTPTEFDLEKNYPNPFNPVTTIEFSLPEASRVELTVFNSTGQVVKNLTRESYQAGTYSVKWDGTNETGQKVASGVYIYRLVAGDFVKTNRMILLK